MHAAHGKSEDHALLGVLLEVGVGVEVLRITQSLEVADQLVVIRVNDMVS